MRTRILGTAVLPFIACSSLAWSVAAEQIDDARARLHAARSLRCIYTADQWTRWTNGERSFPTAKIDPQAPSSNVVYDNINVAKGTARIIGNGGAGDVTVRADGLGGLWIFEKTGIGFTVMTMVFPVYAAGTKDFIVVESRPSYLGLNAGSEQSSGTCSAID